MFTAYFLFNNGLFFFVQENQTMNYDALRGNCA
jgi:hypothetical protein